MEKVLVTGTAGFIGNAVALRLLQDGYHVIGLDCVTDYYDVTLKEERLKRLTASNHFTEERIRLEDAQAVMRIFKQHAPSKVYIWQLRQVCAIPLKILSPMWMQMSPAFCPFSKPPAPIR